MVRFLLTVFFVGLVVAGGCWVGVLALGGPHRNWASFNNDNGRWTFTDDKGHTYASDGDTTTRDLAWTAGDSLAINVPAEVNYTQGPVAKITATGPERLINNLEIQGDKIVFRDRQQWSHHGNHGITLTITAPGVRKFELNGAAKMNIDAYAQDSLNLEVNGAAQVDVAGTARDLNLELNGAGQGNLRHLVNETASVEINGAGQATLATTGHADIEINGVGNARLTHNPTVSKRIHGFGSVETDNSDSDDNDAKAAPPAAPAVPADPAPKAKAHAKAV